MDLAVEAAGEQYHLVTACEDAPWRAEAIVETEADKLGVL